MSEIDYIYYNFLIHNSTNVDQLAEFSETRNEPIIRNAQDWDLAVVRFSIPTSTIPIFIHKPDIYWVGIQNGRLNPIQVTEVDVTLINNTSSNPAVENQFFNYQAWVDNVNSAINVAYILAGAPAGIGREPVVVLDNTNAISVVFPESDGTIGNNDWFPAQNDIVGITDVNPGTDPLPRLWFSRALYLQFFSALDSLKIDTNPFVVVPPELPGINYNLNYLIRGTQRIDNYNDTQANGGRYNVAFQNWENKIQYPCTYSWTKIRRVLLTTSSIQVNSEQIGASRNGIQFSQSMLTDFEIPIDTHPLNRESIFYQPSDFRYVSILSDSEIRKMDLKIYYQDYDTLEIFPLILGPSQDINIKLQFRRIRQSENLLKRIVGASEKENELNVNNEFTNNKNENSGFHIILPNDNKSHRVLEKMRKDSKHGGFIKHSYF